MKASPSIWNLRVYGLVVQDQKVLLTDEIQRGVRMTKFPGGGLEYGESFSECLHREFMEEMQQRIVVGDYYYHNDFLQLSAFNAQEQLISFYYKVELIAPHHFNVVEKECNLSFVRENEPLGTIGSITLVEKIESDYVLLMNSDLLTDINFEDFFSVMLQNDADMIVASVSHRVSVPYAVFEVEGLEIKKLVEKPTYSYHSNAGIYLLKKDLLKYILGTGYNK